MIGLNASNSCIATSLSISPKDDYMMEDLKQYFRHTVVEPVKAFRRSSFRQVRTGLAFSSLPLVPTLRSDP